MIITSSLIRLLICFLLTLVRVEVELSIKKIITKWIGKKHLKFLLFDS